ncbi:MAG TPA: dCTP deaminase [Patescibacteria group bacterium]|nr:MAG: dCTP deaminase [Candidatus Uhrbacteria bacterium RIFCSPHIGHO2_01_FULL_46_23]HLB60194.1 dCTP deaminase [Patescibacteria group bacterium]
MILSDRDIKKAIKSGKIKIDPLPDFDEQLGSCSVDLRLGSQNDADSNADKRRLIILKPGTFQLGITLERVELPDDLCGILHGRSSLGRQGLMIHSTAPLIDAGFQGKIVLELYNSGPKPIELTEHMRICALSFEQLTSPAVIPYYKKKNARYIGQSIPLK